MRVTANYKLSFDALRSQLADLDAWILVLETNGINVWCAAGKGTFGTDELVHRIRECQLEKVVKTRNLHRAARKRIPHPVVALVGYTNAGKSTLFNRLTEAGVYARDQLFATLDPTLRRVELGADDAVILADTVGFVRDLPHELIAAFKSTLQETTEASLLLHLIEAEEQLTSPHLLALLHRHRHDAAIAQADIGLHAFASLDRVEVFVEMFVVDAEGARLLAGPDVLRNIVIDTISYDAEGAVEVAGRAAERALDRAVVRLYLDNAVSAETAVAADGTWATTLGDVAPGVYRLRADQLL